MKVGIIGKGFVGGAMYECFKDKFEVEVYDTDESKSTLNRLESLVDWAEYLFVCVPTPMKDDGSCDTSIVEDVVAKIANLRKDKVVVIKSTVPPGTTKRLAETHGLQMAFNPEFLTEANAVADFRHQPLIVVGTDSDDVGFKVWQLYYSFVSQTGYMPNMKGCTTAEAELFKYVANTFLAVKVTFANEIKVLCDRIGIEYNNVADIAKLDRRLGHSHWKVPGPDGKLGYGGSCFPKDTNGLVTFANSVGIDLWVLTDAMYVNDELRESNYFRGIEVVDK